MIGRTASLYFGVSVGGGSQLILPPQGGDPISVIVQASVGLGLPVISTIEGGIQRVDTAALSVPHSGTDSGEWSVNVLWQTIQGTSGA